MHIDRLRPSIIKRFPRSARRWSSSSRGAKPPSAFFCSAARKQPTVNAQPSQADWLVQTKLHPPLIRGDVILRSRLLAVLGEAVASHPFTLVSAPAGYGKTTLLAHFVERIEQSGCGIGRDAVAWLTLDEEDNDPVRFLLGLVAALQRLHPDCGTTALALLSALSNPAAAARRITAALINDILETLTDPFLLILDDLHRISESAVFVILTYLLEHSPPTAHLVAATRVAPPLSLARLRAQGRAAELSLAQLRFTLEETDRFLNDEWRLNLSCSDLARLQERTEGWAVGLRLLANSLKRLPSSDARTVFIDALSRSNRYIFEYLAEEVLAQQTPQLQRFLLETSILSELTPPLCQAVTGREDAAAVLDELYRRNLFLVALDKSARRADEAAYWPSYRYHALFATFLQEQLRRDMPARLTELHRRAAQAQTDPDRAIKHYLAAEMWEQAAQILDREGRGWQQQGLLDTLIARIHALPPNIRAAHPRLLHLLGTCAWEKGDLSSAQTLLREALQGFKAAGDEVQQGEVLADLANCAFMQADYARSGDLFDRALGHPLPPHSRMQALLGRIGLKIVYKDWDAALADMEEVGAWVESSADPDLLYTLVTHLSPVYFFLPGGPRYMERICRRARSYFGDQISPVRVFIEEYAALLHLWRGEFPQAVEVGERALAIRKRLGGACPFIGIDMAAVIIDAHVGMGNYAAAESYFEPMLAGLQQSPLAEGMMAGFLFEMGRVYWLQGRLKEARAVYAQMCAAENPREWPMAAGFRAKLRGMLAMSEGRYEEAEQAFRQALDIELEEGVSRVWGSVQVLLARLLMLRGHSDKALAVVEPLLAESETRGVLSMVLLNGTAAVPVLQLAVREGVHPTFAARLLDILGAGAAQRPLRVPQTGETLTPREVEVLRLLASGASNREIAARLVISLGTVKSHVHRIFGKMDVSSRTEAAARARELGLV
ncbi:MAG: hypothetical protein D6775_01365 [Caldilineae bacterium]|nr:MAG: hypothetical protein D6775_01365 [Caldilineae bacterium]